MINAKTQGREDAKGDGEALAVEFGMRFDLGCEYFGKALDAYSQRDVLGWEFWTEMNRANRDRFCEVLDLLGHPEWAMRTMPPYLEGAL
jgi:hypothetical protein